MDRLDKQLHAGDFHLIKPADWTPAPAFCYYFSVFCLPVLPAEVTHRSAGLGLAECADDLLFREFRPLHGSTPFVLNRRSRYLTLVLPCRRFRGRRYLTSGAPAIGQSH